SGGGTTFDIWPVHPFDAGPSCDVTATTDAGMSSDVTETMDGGRIIPFDGGSGAGLDGSSGSGSGFGF
ncbi:MAG TPA: hypothetical protein DCQ06_02345, partial [Myxococcales bacterium]|nr:hypothetical protein [Myxococcales bacterium]